jgi:hypothetical protein
VHLHTGGKQWVPQAQDCPDCTDAGTVHDVFCRTEAEVQIPALDMGEQPATCDECESYISFTPLWREGKKYDASVSPIFRS